MSTVNYIRKNEKKKDRWIMAVGFDVGSFNLICSKRGENNEIKSKKEVNAFLEIPLENRFTFNMMKKAKVPLIERDNVAYVVGEAAVNLAYTLQLDLRRPMKDGCLNPAEKDAYRILQIMVHSLIGEVAQDKEVLYYSVPANAVNQETDADYHQKVLEDIFKKYKVKDKTIQAFPINEGLALVFAELADKQYTGVGISCLLPGTKVYANNKIVNIEDVKEGDLVITHRGRPRRVNKIITSQKNAMSTKLNIHGFEYGFVDNHELYVKRDGEWKWIGCEEVSVGDVVGEPTNDIGSKLFTEGFCCGTIQKITYEEYKGVVYDLQVEEDHSFSGPFLTIHNCGAGMINVCYSIWSQPVFTLSSVNSGDWIDRQVARSIGESPITVNKEKTKISLAKHPSSLMERAVQSQYRILIEKTIANIKEAIEKQDSKKTKANDKLDIVLGGGVVSPEGFENVFEEVIRASNFPLPIGSIIKPKDHLYAVARGALMAAENAV